MILRGLVLVLLASTASAQSDPVVGLWQTEADGGFYAHVEMAPCGTAICGTIRQTFDDNGPFVTNTIGRVLVAIIA